VYHHLKKLLAQHNGIRPDNISLAAGSDGVIKNIFEAFVNQSLLFDPAAMLYADPAIPSFLKTLQGDKAPIRRAVAAALTTYKTREATAMLKATGTPKNNNPKKRPSMTQIIVSPLEETLNLAGEKRDLVQDHERSTDDNGQIRVGNGDSQYRIRLGQGDAHHADPHMDHQISKNKNGETGQNLHSQFPSGRETFDDQVQGVMGVVADGDGCSDKGAPLEEEHGELFRPSQRSVQGVAEKDLKENHPGKQDA
jgi:hypothetical protein